MKRTITGAVVTALTLSPVLALGVAAPASADVGSTECQAQTVPLYITVGEPPAPNFSAQTFAAFDSTLGTFESATVELTLTSDLQEDVTNITSWPLTYTPLEYRASAVMALPAGGPWIETSTIAHPIDQSAVVQPGETYSAPLSTVSTTENGKSTYAPAWAQPVSLAPSASRTNVAFQEGTFERTGGTANLTLETCVTYTYTPVDDSEEPPVDPVDPVDPVTPVTPAEPATPAAPVVPATPNKAGGISAPQELAATGGDAPVGALLIAGGLLAAGAVAIGAPGMRRLHRQDPGR